MATSLRSLATRLRGQALIACLPVLIMLFALLGVWRLVGDEQRANELTQLSDSRLFNAQLVLLRLVDAETGIRGYAATHDQRFLDPYNAAVIALPGLIETLRARGNDAVAQRQAETIAQLAGGQLVLLHGLREAISGPGQFDVDAAMRRGKANMDAIRRLVARYEVSERALSAGRRAQFAAIETKLSRVLVGAILFVAIVGISSILFIMNRVLRRLAVVLSNTAKVAANQELGAPLRGYDEIADLDRAVNNMAATIRARNAEVFHYGMLKRFSRDIVKFIDRKSGQIIDVNDAALQTYGYTRDELCLLRVADLRIPEERLAIAQHFENAEADGTMFESTALRKNGETFPIEISARTAIIDGRKIVLEIGRDITDRKRGEAALIQAKDVAQEAARIKADFLANMSHEIRTPMNAIIGLAHITLKTSLDHTQRDYIRKIHQSGRQLLRIINDVLDFSKIEAGKMSIEDVDFDLELVLNNISDLISAKAAEKGIEFIFDVDSKVAPRLKGDSLRLEQILINFCTNAIKFTDSGEIAVKVHVAEDNPTEQLMRFAVTDTGIGLSAEQTKLLFRPFQQADASTTRKFGGTGLGLAISRELAQLMRGTIGVTSEVGKGSTFWFTARLGKGAATPHQHAPQLDLRNRRVLTVDDNAYARAVLSSMLTSMGFVVDQAPSGEEALEMIQTAAQAGEPYEIALLDWRMPGIDGLETAKRIRGLPGLQKSPALVMVTAYAHEEIVENSHGYFAGVLIKPVQPSLLFDIVIQAFSGELHDRAPQAESIAEASPALELLRGARILLAEDNKTNQIVATGLLQDAKMVIDVAENGEIAVRMARTGDYDLILMDMQMPVMDGIEATKAIRSELSLEQLPIVAMTANAMISDRERCLAAGMNDHIAKPIDPEQLFRTLEQWIKPRNPAARRSSVERTSASVDLLDIAGIDTRAGIKRAGGSRTRYEAALREFAADQASVVEDIFASLTAGDTTTAQRAAHSLKGAAGTLGAIGLADCAAAAELALKSNSGIVIALDALSHELAAVLPAIISNLPSWESNPGDAGLVVNAGVAIAVEPLRRLKSLLEASDGEAVAAVDEAQNVLMTVLTSTELGQLRKLVHNADFESALEKLSEISERLSIVLK